MNCIYHHLNPIQFICIAPHACQYQRKLCAECQYEHGENVKHAVPINIFQQIVIMKMKQYKLDEISEISQQRNNFKLMLSQTESMIKKIWEELSDSIKYIYDLIEKKYRSYSNLFNQYTNIAESSYSDLEQIVYLLQVGKVNDWISEKNSYLAKLQKIEQLLEEEVKFLCKKLKNEIKSSIQPIQKMLQVYERKEDLYQVLTQTSNIDESCLNEILGMFKTNKITDCLKYLSNIRNTEKNNFKFITDVIKNIGEIDFNKKNYSLEMSECFRKDLINKISQENKYIIQFLKFLVQLTAIDERFIQCGSNSLYLLVEMKVDMRGQSFENIRIRDTSLIGGNFVRCNFNGSNFDNVDISGMNLNQTQLFNCKWKNLKIHEINKIDDHSTTVRSFCFSPDGTTLASGSSDMSISLWDVKTGQQKAKLHGHQCSVLSVCFSPDGNILASGSQDYSVCLWDVKTGQQNAKLIGHYRGVNSVCFSPDGTILVSGSADLSICLWNIKTGQQKAKLDGHKQSVQSVCFSPDGTTLASGSSDRSVRLWDVKIGLQKAKLDGHTGYVYSVCFSPDGTILASGSYDNSIRLWDIKTGYQRAQLDGHLYSVQSVCFSHDGATLASGSEDYSIRLWDIKTGQQKAKLDGHTSCINTVCFSPDGSTLASSSIDNSIRLWDVQIGQRAQLLLDGNQYLVQSVYFSPDGTTLAYGRGENSISVWDVKTGQEILSSDNRYQDILAQFKSPNYQNIFPASLPTSNITILRISQNPILEAQGALILKGEFIDYKGYDFTSIFKSKGSLILENSINQKQN
ncbi:unnamed protein product [Paramecium octaurelia]|uniref:WD-40 repeat protein n=1 Tax=Paramecium octaurelia TaxID=43137 RepID=A0A8S1YK22_PAROT|nr:unnamed protein product [Paramecium octaurelia]